VLILTVQFPHGSKQDFFKCGHRHTRAFCTAPYICSHPFISRIQSQPNVHNL
jgi:hypothetical protein